MIIWIDIITTTTKLATSTKPAIYTKTLQTSIQVYNLTTVSYVSNITNQANNLTHYAIQLKVNDQFSDDLSNENSTRFLSFYTNLTLFVCRLKLSK